MTSIQSADEAPLLPACPPPPPPRVSLPRAVAAEALGTFAMMLCGLGADAQYMFSGACPAAPGGRGAAAGGNWTTLTFGWGFGVFLGIVVCGGVSGAHLNPAVTAAMTAFGRHPRRRALPYVAAQLLGAFAAAAVIFGEYHAALGAFGARCCGGRPFEITAGCNAAAVWATYPRPFEGVAAGFADQLLGTGLLLLGIFAIHDDAARAPAAPPGPFAKAAAVAALVVAIGGCFGFNAGYAINPARDLAPRVFTAAAGFGAAVFTAGGHWWWVPLVAPPIGAVGGAALYEGAVGRWVQRDARRRRADEGGDTV
jgi:MIP family channel proteins